MKYIHGFVMYWYVVIWSVLVDPYDTFAYIIPFSKWHWDKCKMAPAKIDSYIAVLVVNYGISNTVLLEIP